MWPVLSLHLVSLSLAASLVYQLPWRVSGGGGGLPGLPRRLSLLLLFGSQNMHTEQKVFQAHHHHSCMAGHFNPTRGSKEKTGT